MIIVHHCDVKVSMLGTWFSFCFMVRHNSFNVFRLTYVLHQLCLCDAENIKVCCAVDSQEKWKIPIFLEMQFSENWFADAGNLGELFSPWIWSIFDLDHNLQMRKIINFSENQLIFRGTFEEFDLKRDNQHWTNDGTNYGLDWIR